MAGDLIEPYRRGTCKHCGLVVYESTSGLRSLYAGSQRCQYGGRFANHEIYLPDWTNPEEVRAWLLST